MRIADPACGIGGFLLVAHESIAKHHLLDPEESASSDTRLSRVRSLERDS
jgi:type I restriction-modification system DNA methylase subunit